MGFPYDEATWNAAEGAIFMGFGGSAPGLYSLIAIVVLIGALAVGHIAEAKKYAKHK